MTKYKFLKLLSIIAAIVALHACTTYNGDQPAGYYHAPWNIRPTPTPVPTAAPTPVN